MAHVKPVAFVDIDGVLNVIPAKHGNMNKLPHMKVWPTWETFVYKEKNPRYKGPNTPAASNSPYGRVRFEPEFNEYTITFSPEMIEAVNRLSEKFDVVFLTTWRELAVSVFAPAVGLNVFTFLDADGSESHHGSQVTLAGPRKHRWWKVNAILDYLNEHKRPFVVFDDYLFSPTKKYVRSIANAMGVPSLMVTTFETKGLEPSMVAAAHEFADKLAV